MNSKEFNVSSPSDILSPISRVLVGNKGKAVTRSHALKMVFQNEKNHHIGKRNLEQFQESENVIGVDLTKNPKTPSNENDRVKRIKKTGSIGSTSSQSAAKLSKNIISKFPFHSPTDNILSPASKKLISAKKKSSNLVFTNSSIQNQDENQNTKSLHRLNGMIKEKKSLPSRWNMNNTKQHQNITKPKGPITPLGNHNTNI